MMTYKEEKRCPLCAEHMDWTDQQLNPCKCGYQACVWCWHQIMDMAEKNETEGRCPACRAPYDKDKIVGMEANFERVITNNANRKNKPPKAKPKTNDGKKDLSNVRVIQRKMAYVIGLPLSLADEDFLQRKEFFGQYGKVSKVSLSRTAGGAIQQFVNDSCSVYITFSKEEEAVRCIQSVHGFVLEGRFLKASFGTAKYCHAWLRNTPCNNSACLYLHSVGAEEDSFSKDEVAAAHTRSRVQQIVGATHNLLRGSGNVLPPPIDEHFNYSSATDKPIFRSDLKDVALDMETSNAPPLSKDKDGGVRAPNKMTTFVDIVGRSYSSGPVKDVNGAEDEGVVNLSSELSSVGIHKDNHVEAAHSDAMLCSFSSSSSLANGFPSSKEFKEPCREPSNLWGLGRADVTSSGAVTNEQSGLLLDSEKQILRGPCSALKDDFPSLNDERLKDSESLSTIAPLHPSSHLSKTSEDSRIHAWWHGESCNLNDYNVDEASIACLNSMNDRCNEKKFQSSAKSDKIYRCSNSFSNEEIVEHLRRLDNDNKIHDAQNPTLEAVESSIISNIMSLNFDGNDDSSTLCPSVAGLFDQTDGRHGSSWNLYNNDQSESFVKQVGFVNQATDLDSLSDGSQHFKKCYSLQDLRESKEHYSCKPQYLVSRSQGPAPPGFSLPLREPPPGFPASERSDQVFHANSGSHMVKATTFSKNHYRTPTAGNSSNTGNADIIDPAILSVGRGKPPNGLTNSCLDTRSTYASQPSAFDDEARLWLLMQQSAPMHQDLKYAQTYMQQEAPTAHQDLKYAQTYMQQAPTAQQEVKYSGQIGDRYSSWDDTYGLSSRYMNRQNQSNSPSTYTPFSQQRFANGTFSNGYQPGLDEMQLRNELQSNEKLGFNKFYSGYGDYIIQPSSGDLYTRVFEM